MKQTVDSVHVSTYVGVVKNTARARSPFENTIFPNADNSCGDIVKGINVVL